MDGSGTTPSFADDRSWVFNQERTRAAQCRGLGSFDQYGLKQEQLIEVWQVATKRLIASYRADYFEDFERNITSPYVSGISFSDDGHELIIRCSDGVERREARDSTTPCRLPTRDQFLRRWTAPRLERGAGGTGENP